MALRLRNPVSPSRRLLTLWVFVWAMLPVVAFQAAAMHPADQFGQLQPLSDRGERNLAAMTRLLGDVRFFHPLEYDGKVDWDAFATQGARAAEPAADDVELAERLEAWIRQIAPTVRVRAASSQQTQAAIEQGEAGDDLIDQALHRPDIEKPATVVHWNHHGINLTGQPGIYFSRLEKERLDAGEQPDPAHDPARPSAYQLADGVCAIVPRLLYESARDDERMNWPAREKVMGINDRAVRCAGVALVWTVLQHFYPYFDVVETEWNAELVAALRSAATAENTTDYHDTLQRLVGALHDGHGGVYELQGKDWFIPEIVIAHVEGQWVVTTSNLPVIDVGDVIRSIYGEEIAEREQRLTPMISSATEGWTHHRLSLELLKGPINTQLFLEVENPTNGARTVRVGRTVHMMQMRERRPATISEVESRIWYVDIDRATDTDIDDFKDKLAAADGVIFDLRGYPRNISTCVIAHLIDEPVTCAQWHVPIVSKPDRLDMDFQFSNWNVQPIAPRFRGKAAFIIDGRAISYAETYMGIIEQYKLAEIVGEPTAGTNGNVSAFQVLGKFSIAFTGMKVLKHDGSQHHGVGIKPTVPCSCTIEGVRAGRDELLERAIAVVKGED